MGAYGALTSTFEYPAPKRYLSGTTVGTGPPWGDDQNGAAGCTAGGGGPCVLETGQIQNVNWNANIGPVAGWHNGGSNILFVDGHVKWLTGSQISGGIPAATQTSPQGTGGLAEGTQTGKFVATFSTI